MSDIDIIKSYYEPKIKEFKEDHRILGWESEEAHLKRFKILYDNVDLNGKKLLDVGCGLGNLLNFLTDKNIQVDYTGIDILENMITLAKQKNPHGKFYCVDILENPVFDDSSFDIVYASGIFNLRMSNNKEFLSKALKKFFMLSKSIVVFNLLHDKSTDKEDKYYYYKTSDINKALESATIYPKEINFIEDYLSNDFTVICKK